MLSNYHTHTWRCNHAAPNEREYIEQAIAAGITVLGFSDHSPYPFPNGHQSGFRMTLTQTQDYFNTLRALQQEYADRIQIHIGFEAEYYPLYFKDLLQFIRPFGCEYLILGQHFIRNETEPGCEYSGMPTESPEILQLYTSQTVEGLSTGMFSYLAHPDLINWQGDPVLYEQQMHTLCRSARELDIPLEINLLGLYEHRQYPNEMFWQIAGQEGCTAIIGCDAHEPVSFARVQAEHDAEALAKRCGLTLIRKLRLRKP